MPYPDEHSARLKDPKQYDRFRRQNDKFGKGIHAIWGIKKEKVELQSIRFNVSKFTVKQAKDWLKKHKYKYIKFESATGKSKEGLHWECYCINCGYHESKEETGACKECPKCGKEMIATLRRSNKDKRYSIITKILNWGIQKTLNKNNQ